MSENNTHTNSHLQTSTTGDVSTDAPPVDANDVVGTITHVSSEPADELLGALEEAGYEVAFDTDERRPGDILHEPTIRDSRLPSEVIVARRGRPRLAPAVAIEGSDNPEGPKRYLGSDGHYHVENQRARQAFEDYFNMGASRSLARLAKRYFEEKPSGWEKNESEPAILRKLGEYSANLDWQNRIRMALARQSAQVVTNAQKQAAKNRTERIRRSQKLQDIAETIFDRAQILGADVEQLPPEVARQLIKPALQMMEIGMIQERLEAGESLERIKPPKPINQMDEEELDAYIELLRSER